MALAGPGELEKCVISLERAPGARETDTHVTITAPL